MVAQTEYETEEKELAPTLAMSRVEFKSSVTFNLAKCVRILQRTRRGCLAE